MTYKLDNLQFLIRTSLTPVDSNTQIYFLWVNVTVRTLLQNEHGVLWTWLYVSKHRD